LFASANALVHTQPQFCRLCGRRAHEGIIAKQRDLPYQSGRSKRRLKIKNPESPAIQRVLDETF
jgi:ATP-dependent DNA ligase